jgi:hypothetical protein
VAIAPHRNPNQLKGNTMDININVDYDDKKKIWSVWNITSHSEFIVKFDCRADAIAFMVELLKEVKG